MYHEADRSGELTIPIPTQMDCETVLSGKNRGKSGKIAYFNENWIQVKSNC